MNQYHSLSDEPAEIRKALEPVLEELIKIQHERALLAIRDKELRFKLLNSLDMMGLEPGHTMRSDDQGIRVRLLQKTFRRLNKDLLEEMVAPEIIEKCTNVESGKTHLRVGKDRIPV